MTTRKRTRLDSGSVYEVESDEPSQIVLEIPDSDVVKTISQYFDASFNGQNSTLPVTVNVSSAESDSGDSLFLTQAVVPVAVRSVRRYHSKEGLTYSPEIVEDRWTEGRSAPFPRRNSKKYVSKKYSLSLLERVYRYEQLTSQKSSYKNAHLLKSLFIAISAIGGFFKCVKTQTFTKAKKTQTSASAKRCLDEKGGISPLSEHEEESDGSDDDIKVVEKDLFMPFLVKKNRQQWCHPSSKATEDSSKATEDFSKAPKDFSKAPKDFSKAPKDFSKAPKDFSKAPKDFTTKTKNRAQRKHNIYHV